MNYFENCTTTAEIKKRYRQLAFKYHPDRGGDSRTMQIINDQYHAILKGKHETTETGSDGTHTYYYNQAYEQAIIEKMAELLKLDLPGCELWLIGTWIWIKGDTKPHRKKLGKHGAGMIWHRQRNAWYWKPYKAQHWYNSRADFPTLAATYGAKEFTKDDDNQKKKNKKRPRTKSRALI